MGYAAVKGGIEAIRAAEELVRRRRVVGRSRWLDAEQIAERLRLAVDRVQGEAGLWAPELAARAIRQTEGDVIEAAHLLRSHRSTMARFSYSEPADPDEMEMLRRIVPAYRNPPGPQMLGRTLDYTGRLIDLTPDEELQARYSTPNGEREATPAPGPDGTVRLLELLRERGLLAERRLARDAEPFDITRLPLPAPAPRSARLSTLARGETGSLVNLWYQGVRGHKAIFHEITLGEVRHGRLPVRVAHGLTGRPVSIGAVAVTEVEAIEDTDGIDEDRTRFDAGYGLVFGHNERKAIAMAALDVSIERDRGRTGLEQSVLQTCDGLDSSGFLEHLKLPHYVTFRSMVERKLRLQQLAQAGEGR